MTEFVRDDFARTVGSGWGTAPVGGAWTESLSGGAISAVIATAPGLARIGMPGIGAAVAQERLASATPTVSGALACRFRTANVASDTGLLAHLRTSGPIATPTGYYVAVLIRADGSMTLALGTVAAGVYTGLGASASAAFSAGSYVSGAWWRLEVELAVDTGGTTFRARLWNTAGSIPDQSDGWVTVNSDLTGPQTAGFYQLRVNRVAPATDPAQVFDIDDLYITDLPRARFTYTVTNPTTRTISVDGSTSSGDIQSREWRWGDHTAPGSGVTASHSYAAAGYYSVQFTLTTRWGTSWRAVNQVLVAYDVGPDVLPIIQIDGDNVCDLAFDIAWGSGATHWADPIDGSTCSIRLRGRLAYEVGMTVAVSCPNVGELWLGSIDQVVASAELSDAADSTLVIAMDTASRLGRRHMAKEIVLNQGRLPARLDDLRPSDLIHYRAKYGGVATARYPTLKKKVGGADKLGNAMWLDGVRDAIAASVAFAYVARNGDIVYGPWEAPAGLSSTPFINLDAGLDCASHADVDRNALDALVNRWMVGSGDNVDRRRVSSVNSYGEHAYRVNDAVLDTETDLPTSEGMQNAMANPTRSVSIELPVVDFAQKAIRVEPLDLALWESNLYAVMGVSHRVSHTDGWRVTLTMDRNPWAVDGRTPP